MKATKDNIKVGQTLVLMRNPTDLEETTTSIGYAILHAFGPPIDTVMIKLPLKDSK